MTTEDRICLVLSRVPLDYRQDARRVMEEMVVRALAEAKRQWDAESCRSENRGSSMIADLKFRLTRIAQLANLPEGWGLP